MITEQTIKAQTCKLFDRIRADTLTNRYLIGKAVRDLQNFLGDITPTGGKSYVKAKARIAAWAIERNCPIAPMTIDACLYVFLRLNKNQMAILAAKGMAFYQAHGMIRSYKDKPSNVSRYVSDVKTGKETDFARFNRSIQAKSKKGRGSRGSNIDHGDELPKGIVFPPPHAEEESQVLACESLLSQYRTTTLIGLLNKASKNRRLGIKWGVKKA